MLFAFIALETNGVASYRILGIFHTVSPSHYFVGSALMKGLAADGHNVTIISPFKEKKPIPNYTEVYLDGTFDKITNSKLHFIFMERKIISVEFFSICSQVKITPGIF